MINCILDLDKIIKTGQLSASNDVKADLFFVKHFAAQEDSDKILEAFSKEYSNLTPFVNLYYCLCVSSLNWSPSHFSPEDVMKTKLDQSTYLQRYIVKNRLQPKNQPSDMQIIASILTVRFAQLLPNE